MFAKKKADISAPSKKKHDLGMFGLDMNFDDDMNDNGDDDDDFEAELAALQSGQPRKKARSKPKKNLMDLSDINKLAAQAMKDDDDDDEEDDIDENDLLAELEGLQPMESNNSTDTTPTLIPATTTTALASNATTNTHVDDSDIITKRKMMYESAISNAEKMGEGSKVRRYKRGLKEIERMLKAVKSGKPVNMTELPPVVALGNNETASDKTPSQSMPEPTPAVNNETPLIQLDHPQTIPSPVVPQPTITTTPAAAKPKMTIDQPPGAKPTIEPPAQPQKTIQPPSKPGATIQPASKPGATIQPPSKAEKPNVPSSKATNNQSVVLNQLNHRKSQYREAAKIAAKSGDKETARNFLRMHKEFDAVIEAVKNGKEVDMSQCPPSPTLDNKGMVTSSLQQQSVPSLSPHTQNEVLTTAGTTAAAGAASGPPSAPKTILEALQQRLEKYESAVDEAKKEGNNGKARRMTRIVKQYQSAVRDHKAKKPVDFAELPTPPGYPPIPTTEGVGTSSAWPAQDQPALQPPARSTQPPARSAPPAATTPSQAPGGRAQNANEVPSGRNQKELAFLLNRQNEFKMCALQAKKRGDIEKAKNYLRTSKGFDAMIEAAKNGLRVDLTKVPASPNVTNELNKRLSPTIDFEMVSHGDCVAEPSGNRKEVFTSLEKSLKHQYEMCKRNMEHYSKMGDIDGSKKFEKLALNCRKDYEAVQNAFKHGSPQPRYHYENRTFTILKSNTDLGDQDCELTVVKCINIPLPSGYSKDDMKIYVTFEFPFPNDQPQTGYTEAIKHTINPEFKQSFKLSIDRKNRALVRIMRRQGVKLEVKHSRGFLKGDKTIGQATIKLAAFENKCDIHQCVDIMDGDKGRKAVGGKVEAKIRIREPLTDKDVEILTEKWLVIDAFVSPSNRPISASGSQQKATVNPGTSKQKAGVIR